MHESSPTARLEVGGVAIPASAVALKRRLNGARQDLAQRSGGLRTGRLAAVADANNKSLPNIGGASPRPDTPGASRQGGAQWGAGAPGPSRSGAAAFGLGGYELPKASHLDAPDLGILDWGRGAP